MTMNHIVLFHPEIPQNTGNIMRTAMATESKLHIIGPLPFTLNDETIKRAGLDYREHLQYTYYESYQDFMVKNHHPILHCLTRYGDKIYTEITVKNKVEEIFLMFGSETSGISAEIMKQHQNHLYRIPMSMLARSLNLSNTVALVIYEVLRQQQFSGLATKEVLKGENFLKEKLNQ
jgi:tRNA (cytidine/uridine-2'-O-)-methyltransferase